MNGMYLTSPHIRKLIKHLGGSVKGSSLLALSSQLFGLCFGGDDAKTKQAQEAFEEQQNSLDQKIEEDLDSD